MSSSSSATGLNRARSLRQPTAGLGRAQKKDEAKKGNADKGIDGKNKGAVSSASVSSASVPASDESRSRLPQPGASSIATRTRAGTASAGNTTAPTSRIAPGTRSRPNSGIFGLERASSLATRKAPPRDAPTEEAEPSKTTRPASTITRLARPKSIASASQLSSMTSPLASPSTATYKPLTASTTKPQSPRKTAHSHAKSTTTSHGSTTALRPPRPSSAGSIASTSTTSTVATNASKRPVGVATRASHPREKTTNSSANTSAGSGSSTTTMTRATKQTATDDAPRLRPAFNTLQQHYSPARNLAPKPLTSTYLAPPTPSKLPANVAISSETARLQTELLQLHLLHRDAEGVTASWHASAREKLGLRFTEVVKADAEVRKQEAAVEESQNMAALKAWGDGSGKGLEDKIQTLDGVLSGLWSLGEPGGRYARVVRKFEKWVDQMTTAVEARQKAGGSGALMESDEVAFIGELDPAWKDDVSSLARKLDEWRRQLGQLVDGLPEQGTDEGQPRSSLVKIVAGCRSQVHDMLAELDTIGYIEREAIAREAAWIRRMNREEEGDDTRRAGAIWRAF